MTPDQFQRDVIDILGLFGKDYDEKVNAATTLLQRAVDVNELIPCIKYTAAFCAVYANCKGYSLETIFQMALDELEKEHGTKTSLL